MKKQETIAIITSGFLPIPATKGGAVENLIDIMISQNEKYKKIIPIIFSIEDKEARKESLKYKSANFIFVKINNFVKILDKITFWFFDKVIKKNNSRSYRFIFQRLYFYLICSNYLKKNNYDKVLLENHFSMFLTLKFNKNYKKYKGKYFYHCHNECTGFYGCEDIIKNTEKFISVSKYRSKTIEERFKLPKNKYEVVLNSCSNDINKVSTIEEINKLKNMFQINKEKVIIYIGRVVDDKGVLELIKACKKIKNIKYKLLIIGAALNSNEILTEYERKVFEEINNENNEIFLTGYVNHNELYKYYDLADLVVVPSLFEDSAPLTIIESLSKGKAIIATNSGGIPEYTNEKCAILVERNKNMIDSLSVNIEKILKNDELKKQMEEESKKVSYKYTEKKYYDNLIDILTREEK